MSSLSPTIINALDGYR
jgi:hypothetical protein